MFKHQLYIISIVLCFSYAKADDSKCTGSTSWELIKAPATKPGDFSSPKAHKRIFYLGEDSLVWCTNLNKYKNEADYSTLGNARKEGTVITVPLIRDSKQRPTGSSIQLSFATTRVDAAAADTFINVLNEKIRDYTFSCAATGNSWNFSKKGNKKVSPYRERTLFLGNAALYWCEGTEFRGYMPYHKMGAVTRRETNISIKLTKTHGNREANSYIKLRADSEPRGVNFVTALNNKKRQGHLEETVGYEIEDACYKWVDKEAKSTVWTAETLETRLGSSRFKFNLRSDSSTAISNLAVKSDQGCDALGTAVDGGEYPCYRKSIGIFTLEFVSSPLKLSDLSADPGARQVQYNRIFSPYINLMTGLGATSSPTEHRKRRHLKAKYGQKCDASQYKIRRERGNRADLEENSECQKVFPAWPVYNKQFALKRNALLAKSCTQQSYNRPQMTISIDTKKIYAFLKQESIKYIFNNNFSLMSKNVISRFAADEQNLQTQYPNTFGSSNEFKGLSLYLGIYLADYLSRGTVNAGEFLPVGITKNDNGTYSISDHPDYKPINKANHVFYLREMPHKLWKRIKERQSPAAQTSFRSDFIAILKSIYRGFESKWPNGGY